MAVKSLPFCTGNLTDPHILSNRAACSRGQVACPRHLIRKGLKWLWADGHHLSSVCIVPFNSSCLIRFHRRGAKWELTRAFTKTDRSTRVASVIHGIDRTMKPALWKTWPRGRTTSCDLSSAEDSSKSFNADLGVDYPIFNMLVLERFPCFIRPYFGLWAERWEDETHLFPHRWRDRSETFCLVVCFLRNSVRVSPMIRLM